MGEVLPVFSTFYSANCSLDLPCAQSRACPQEDRRGQSQYQNPSGKNHADLIVTKKFQNFEPHADDDPGFLSHKSSRLPVVLFKLPWAVLNLPSRCCRTSAPWASLYGIGRLALWKQCVGGLPLIRSKDKAQGAVVPRNKRSTGLCGRGAFGEFGSGTDVGRDAVRSFSRRSDGSSRRMLSMPLVIPNRLYMYVGI